MDENENLGGVDIALMGLISEKMGFTVEYMRTKAWGVREESGNWTGTIGAVQYCVHRTYLFTCCNMQRVRVLRWCCMQSVLIAGNDVISKQRASQRKKLSKVIIYTKEHKIFCPIL